jgi:EAL domain-containing protein (putative c-di-GMP-specific phosphodiesterase class I)/FixJ family two-component response regulator
MDRAETSVTPLATGRPHTIVGGTPEAATVLIVDDDDHLRALFRLAVLRAGLAAVEASNGRDALRLIETQSIGIVVCDLAMPGMSGLEVVRALRARPESATLPFLLMTGSSDGDAVLDALDAGADDFLAKPVRVEELVARVLAHLRTGSAWRQVVETELRMRAEAVGAIGHLAVSGGPEEAAATLVAELARRTGARYVGILQLSSGSRLQPLARYSATNGLARGGSAIDARRTRDLLGRAKAGPWAVAVGEPDPGEETTPFWEAQLELAAGAPIYAGADLVAILTMGVAGGEAGSSRAIRQANLLATVIDYAAVLSAVFGPAIAERRQVESERARLRRILRDRAFSSVYQPIVALGHGAVIGFEALTRFADGAAPDVRFPEARAVGLASEYEIAAVQSAVAGAANLPKDAFLSVNLSPDVLASAGRTIADLVERSGRTVVIEVTEHAQIADYAAFRQAVQRLGNVAIAVDDAGAGFASLRHILELEPTYTKLDLSLVRGIDEDPLRQALAAGLVYFAVRGGCRLIAEGVETEAEARTLRDIGVELGQGYLFGRPEALIG